MNGPLKILVCIKQVPDSGETLSIDADGRIRYGPLTVFRMNRFDEFALEEALLIKERIPGTTVHALSLGPERVKNTIRRALETGADHGIHLLTPAEYPCGPWFTASRISSYARGKGYDLILAGVMAEDDMACQVGQLAAALLDLPCATSVIHEETDREAETVVVEREIEGGGRAALSIKMPAVLTIQSGINLPRYPSLSNVLRARTQALEVIDAGNPASSPDPKTKYREPDQTAKGILLQGSTREKARKLRAILHEKGLLR
jgi:electron transfer flavoprotein beta subunit